MKQIAVSDLELGMFVHKCNGGWLDHPFWKAKFLIDDPDRLAAIKAGKLRSVVIDTEKGRDLAAPAAPRPAQPASAQDANSAVASPAASRIRSLKQRTEVQIAAAQPVSMAQELNNA